MAAGPFATPAVQFFALAGGVDQVTPTLSLPPGVLRDALNFEADFNGGYARISGYERFSGETQPSDKAYAMLRVANASLLPVGTTITGSTSAAVSVVCGAVGNVLAITVPTGSTAPTGGYLVGENLLVSAAVVTSVVDNELTVQADSQRDEAQLAAFARDRYRGLMSALPGSGPVLGVWVYKDVVYAFRNNTGGTAALMYKATSSGWVLVTTPALNPAGRYEFVNYNFGGASGTLKMYGCDGQNKAFVFDGTTFTQISTGVAVDKPTHIAAHANFLFLAFGASVQISPLGNPTGTWTPVYGAGEIAIGEDVTALQPYLGGQGSASLLIFSRTKIRVLYGYSTATFQLANYSDTSGALPWTVAMLEQPYFVNQIGVMSMAQSQNYGSFETATLTRRIQRFMDQERGRATAAIINRKKGQYRVFFNDGWALYLTFQGSKLVGAMPVQLAHTVSCACNALLSTDEELSLVGGSNGTVYLLDKGPSFDGQTVPYYLQAVFSAFKSPRSFKSFRRGVFEINCEGHAEFNVGYDVGQLLDDNASAPDSPMTIALRDAVWDDAYADAVYWDGSVGAQVDFEMDGDGDSVSLRVVGNSTFVDRFTLSSAMLTFVPRRLMR